MLLFREGRGGGSLTLVQKIDSLEKWGDDDDNELRLGSSSLSLLLMSLRRQHHVTAGHVQQVKSAQERK